MFKQKPVKAENYKVRFDWISETFLFISIFAFGFSITFSNVLGFAAGILLALSLSGSLFWDTVQFDLWVDKKEFFTTLLWAGIDLSVISLTYLVLHFPSPIPNSSLTFNGFTNPDIWIQKTSSMLVGVTEETLFGALGFPWFYRRTGGNFFVAAGIICGFFAIFHFAVYRSDILALILVTMGRFILTLSIWWTRRMTPSILAHGGWNFFVSG